MRIIELEEVDSTNEYCKQGNFSEDIIVTAKRQTGGRGTKGRSFISDLGGLYISIMRHYSDFPAGEAFRIMVSACVAVCKTLEDLGIKPQIRWANDVLVGGKKICGTLIENTFQGNKIVRSVVGMGININNPILKELEPVATSVFCQLSKEISVDIVKSLLLKNLERQYTIAEYKKYTEFLGRKVILRTGNGDIEVTALDIGEDGRLIVKNQDGSIDKISSAEVSLRP